MWYQQFCGAVPPPSVMILSKDETKKKELKKSKGLLGEDNVAMDGRDVMLQFSGLDHFPSNNLYFRWKDFFLQNVPKKCWIPTIIFMSQNWKKWSLYVILLFINSKIPHFEMSDFVLSCKTWPWIESHNSMQFALGVTDAVLQLSWKAQFWI